MSFVISVYVREGIVMASDSRLTLTMQKQSPAGHTETISVPSSDNNYKTFVTPGNVGISTFGAADIGGVPLAGFIESFILDTLGNAPHGPEDVANALLAHFGGMSPAPSTGFLVGGYVRGNAGSEQQVWSVDVNAKAVTRSNPRLDQGAAWGGESDVLTRILIPAGSLDDSGKLLAPLPHFPVPFQFFTLQDAIDFAVFAIRSTIDALRFQARAKSVGGPIDVLVLKPDTSFWVAKKNLSA